MKKQFSYIRSLFEDLAFQQDLYRNYSRKPMTQAEHDAIRDLHEDRIHKIRYKIRQYYADRTDQLQQSMLTGARRQISNGDDLCDAFTEYWIVPDPYLDDNDARQICEDEIIEFYSPYDCTGKLFTSRIRFARVPVGYAFVHVLHRDL